MEMVSEPKGSIFMINHLLDYRYTSCIKVSFGEFEVSWVGMSKASTQLIEPTFCSVSTAFKTINLQYCICT